MRDYTKTKLYQELFTHAHDKFSDYWSDDLINECVDTIYLRRGKLRNIEKMLDLIECEIGAKSDQIAEDYDSNESAADNIDNTDNVINLDDYRDDTPRVWTHAKWEARRKVKGKDTLAEERRMHNQSVLRSYNYGN